VGFDRVSLIWIHRGESLPRLQELSVPEDRPPDLEARLRAEVDRSVAPYVGKVPPLVLAKLRELSERYWREHPQASRILHVLERREPARSGPTSTAAAEVQDEAAGAAKE
jgi:hypothetical protein